MPDQAVAERASMPERPRGIKRDVRQSVSCRLEAVFYLVLTLLWINRVGSMPSATSPLHLRLLPIGAPQRIGEMAEHTGIDRILIPPQPGTDLDQVLDLNRSVSCRL